MTSGRRAMPAVGLTDAQVQARAASGIGMPRSVMPKPHLVRGIVALACEHCGCTNARATDSKDRRCSFCGKEPKKLREGFGNDEAWLAGDGPRRG